MMEWISQVSEWLQTWLSPSAGLWGLFLSAFLSATVLPGSSEVVMTALVTAYPELAWMALLVATCGNLTGAALTFGMGLAGRQRYERFQRVRVDEDKPLIQKLRRLGPPALVLSILPLVGDALVLAAGWFRMPFWQCMLWIAVGKGCRYLLLVLGLKGLLSFGA